MLKRIILHAGTPKTGTTSLQISLARHQAALLSRGYYVPPTVDQAYGMVASEILKKPKHQYLIPALMNADGRNIRECFAGILGDAPAGSHTCILSTEGIYHHWWDFSDSAREELANLSSKLAFELWVWFRDPYEFFVSNYIQMLKNPVGSVKCYGQDWSPDQMLDDPWFSRRLDYARFAREVSGKLGRQALRMFAWQGNTVAQFFNALGESDLGVDEPREHSTPGVMGVEMLRLVNRYGIENDRRNEAVAVIARLDSLVGAASSRFDPGSDLKKRLERDTAYSLSILKTEWGLDLRS